MQKACIRQYEPDMIDFLQLCLQFFKGVDGKVRRDDRQFAFSVEKGFEFFSNVSRFLVV
jgi:hypothetical protein